MLSFVWINAYKHYVNDFMSVCKLVRKTIKYLVLLIVYSYYIIGYVYLTRNCLQKKIDQNSNTKHNTTG